MSASNSVTHWISELKAGEHAAAQKLWEAYFRRLVGLARKKLQGTRRRAADEEDVALSAFNSFCLGAENGRFPSLADRDNLWQLLVVITERKARYVAVHEGRKKRGGGKVRGESAWPEKPNGSSAGRGLEQIVGREPTPDFAVQVAEEYRRLLALLPDRDLQFVAQWKMEGNTNDEIAARLGCAVRSVQRKLRVIRSCWSHLDLP
jgi:DNA-directed RNA polymerase specialized sigma24 family protein